MTNRIRRLDVVSRLHDLTQPEIWIAAEPDAPSAALDLRGRLMGPRCVYATTVEVAYPLRPFVRRPDDWPELSRRVVIPEASLWEPESPFLYQGPVELWEDGTACDQGIVSHGLRLLQLSGRGLRLNGRSLALRAKSVAALTTESAPSLRQEGWNTLLVPVAVETLEVWSEADRLGFFVLGRLESETSVRQAQELSGHPCCLGWVVSDEVFQCQPAAQLLGSLPRRPDGLFVGVDLRRLPREQFPDGIHFVVGPEEILAALPAETLPRLVRLTQATGPVPTARPGLLGWLAT